MLTGMSIVFLFLVMLIGAVKIMAYCVAKFFPETEAPIRATQATAANSVTPVVTAAITAAIHQHRAK